MKFPVYLALLDGAEKALADAFRQTAEAHGDEPDVQALCTLLGAQCDRHRERLRPSIARYGSAPADDEPERLHASGLSEPRRGPLGLLRDLHDLYVLATFIDATWMIVKQAAQALRDQELLDVITGCEGETTVQLRWVKTRMKQAAPQALIAAE